MEEEESSSMYRGGGGGGFVEEMEGGRSRAGHARLVNLSSQEAP